MTEQTAAVSSQETGAARSQPAGQPGVTDARRGGAGAAGSPPACQDAAGGLPPRPAVCRVAELPVQGARVVRRAGEADVALFRTHDDRVFAVLDRCPHKGGPLSEGLVHGTSVTCPLHGWVIDMETGRARAPDEGCARRVPVRVDDGWVYLGDPGPAAEGGAQ